MLLEGSIGEHSVFGKLKKAFGSKVVRRGLVAGVIGRSPSSSSASNTVMYYSPTIVQLACFASSNTAMASHSSPQDQCCQLDREHVLRGQPERPDAPRYYVYAV